MKFTDIFIRRPVLAVVISLFILVLGLRSINMLPVLQYPKTENAVVTVTTVYTGADPELVAGFITTPLENSIAQANGIDYMTSQSRQGISIITANLRLNSDSGKVLTEINTKVNAVLNQLPQDAQRPVIEIAVGETIDSMFLTFSSENMSLNQITDYLIRIVQPQLQAVEGIQTVEIMGGKSFALRVWLDPRQLAAYSLNSTDVWLALAANDYLSAVGQTKGLMVQVDLTATTNLKTLEEFRNMIIKEQNGAVVRLSDVAKVTLGAEDYESRVTLNGEKGVFMGIKVAPTANLLQVIGKVKEVFPDIQAQLPEGLKSTIAHDATIYVDSSINEVIKSLFEALIIVTLVVFLFIGSFRTVLIPTVTIPLSLIGAFTMMLILGFSINLLTLLALVLGIGLVVDDAIIIVENVDRHLEEGLTPFDAAILAARELANPIIVMTVVLIAVYIPVGFMGGLTGALFTEFAFTLVGAVTISAIVALTLSPMMCSRIIKPHDPSRKGIQARFVRFLDARFESLKNAYERYLHGSLNYIPVVIVFTVIIIASLYFLYSTSKSELAPTEDQGFFMAISTTSPDATIDQRSLNADAILKDLRKHTEFERLFQADIPGMSFTGMVLKPWDERDKTSMQIVPVVQKELDQIAGVKAVAFIPPALPGSRGMPIQFVIKTTDPFERLDVISRNFMEEAQASGMFMFLDNDLKYDLPQTSIIIDRDMASQLGLTMKDIGYALSTILGGGYVNYFSMEGRSYKVIPQIQQRYRLNSDQMNNYYIRTDRGSSVPLSTVVSLDTITVPESLNHFQQQNAATISGVTLPGVTQGEALKYLKGLADKNLPQSYSVDYSGPCRQFVQESSALMVTFFFALIIIFLALAAQFESFRDPIIILITVPMSICGAMIFINLGIGGASLNIYTEVGLVTLIGLISKHGILIVEFANNLQRKGHSKREAIEMAAGIRLRPILMTTAAMVLGVIPLIIAAGAGAESRYNLGLVIASGLAIGTLFTLFVVPSMYLVLATDHAKQIKNRGEDKKDSNNT
jgi:multidrug efflux pump